MIRKLLAVIAATVLAVLWSIASPGIAHAADLAPPPTAVLHEATTLTSSAEPAPNQASTQVAVDNVLDKTLTLKLATIAFLLGTLLPLVNGLVTKARASPGVKATVNLILSIIGGVLVAFQTNNGKLTVLEVLAAAAAVYTGSGVTYNHLWKPTNVAKKVANVAPHRGIGKPVFSPPPR